MTTIVFAYGDDLYYASEDFVASFVEYSCASEYFYLENCCL